MRYRPVRPRSPYVRREMAEATQHISREEEACLSATPPLNEIGALNRVGSRPLRQTPDKLSQIRSPRFSTSLEQHNHTPTCGDLAGNMSKNTPAPEDAAAGQKTRQKKGKARTEPTLPAVVFEQLLLVLTQCRGWHRPYFVSQRSPRSPSYTCRSTGSISWICLLLGILV